MWSSALNPLPVPVVPSVHRAGGLPLPRWVIEREADLQRSVRPVACGHAHAHVTTDLGQI